MDVSPPYSRVLSILRYFGRRPSAKALRPNSTTSSMVQHSLFFKIPLELRNEIYADVVVSRDPIHVMENGSCRDKQVFFRVCTIDLTHLSSSCDCNSVFRTTSARLVDTSLLSVSKQIRKEAITALFERNHFHLDHEHKLSKMARVFEGPVAHIRSCSLIYTIYDKPLANWKITSIKTDWAGFSALRKLTIYATIYKRANDLFEDGVLNNFRPMAFLPLTSFDLYISQERCGGVPEAIGRRLSLRAKEILLKDPILLEEEQVKPSVSYLKTRRRRSPTSLAEGTSFQV